MTIKHIIRNILPYALSNWYLERNKQSSKDFKIQFNRVAKKLEDNGRFLCNWEDKWQCANDDTSTTPFDPHYIYHAAWSARILAETKPSEHVDISSFLYFVAITSAFVPIKFYDFRPAKINLSNFSSGFADITRLPFMDDSIPSLSSMHVVEHIGLGRYGDKFDPQGDIKAMRELERVLKPDGQLLFVVPVGGKAKIHYNAHRVYRFQDILGQFSTLSLHKFSLVTDESDFIDSASESDANSQKYGCGCFYFKKGCPR